MLSKVHVEHCCWQVVEASLSFRYLHKHRYACLLFLRTFRELILALLSAWEDGSGRWTYLSQCYYLTLKITAPGLSKAQGWCLDSFSSAFSQPQQEVYTS